MVDTLLRDAQALSSANQATYERLQAALHLNLRRQIYIAICDDLGLRDRLVEQLQAEQLNLEQASPSAGHAPIYPQLVTLRLDLSDPNPIAQISQWLTQSPPPPTEFDARMPAFQIIGIETLSRQPAANQWLFLNHLQEMEHSLPALESSLLLWVPRPWGRMIPQAAPDFWRCRSAVFEFEGDPTPLASPQGHLATRRPAAIQRHAPQSSPAAQPASTPAHQPVSAEELALLKAEFLPPPSYGAGDRPSGSYPAPPAAESLFDGEPSDLSQEEPDFTALLNAPDEPDLLDRALDEDDQDTELLPPPQEISQTFHDLLDEPDLEELTDGDGDEGDPVAADDPVSQAVMELQGDDGAIAATDLFTSHAAASEPEDGPGAVEDPRADAAQFAFPLADDETSLSLAQFIQEGEGAQEMADRQEADAHQGMAAPQTAASPQDTDSSWPDLPPDGGAEPPSSPIVDTLPTDDDVAHADYPDDAVTALLGNVTESLLLEDAPDEVSAGSPWASPLEEFPNSAANTAVQRDAEDSPANPTLQNGPVAEPGQDSEVAVADAAPLFLNPVSLSSAKSASPGATESDPAASGVTDEAIADDPRARSLLQQISGLEQQQAPGMVLASAYRALGNLYRDRIEQGDIAPANLLRAMKAYEQVLRWVDDQSPMWAEVLNDMGNLCWLLSRCAPSPEEGLPHLQQGIHAYQLALTKINPQTHPQTYPMIQNNLGAAYGDLARYQNPTEHLQKSIAAYREALQYRRADLDPLRYASTQNNLGTTYWNLAQHRQPLENLKQAIAAYSEALSYYQSDTDPLNYAMIQNNLGTAYWNLAQHEQSQEWLQQAIRAYQEALKYRTLETAPAAFAATQNNLGTAYWHIATNAGDAPQVKLECLKQAVRAYEAALQAVTVMRQNKRPIPLNFDVMATHNNLGLVQYQVATHPQFDPATEDASQYLDAALEQHLTALHGWQGRPELRQTALNCIIQTLQAIYAQKGLVGQNLALSKIPGYLLPEILPKL